MDATAFEAWLGWIAALSEPQRRRVWLALSTCEADSPEIEALHPVNQGGSRSNQGTHEPPLASPPSQARLANEVGAAGVADLGQRRVDSVGCPHCHNHDVVRWGRARDLPRYRCKACSRTFNALTKTLWRACG